MDDCLDSWPRLDCFFVDFADADTAVDDAEGPYGDLSRETNEIRLVKVLSGSPSDPIRCRISSFALNEAPRYTALSYTWGRPDQDCTIELNGHRAPVRKNLWRFLHQSRELPAWRGANFWIDALCIQQSNPEERTHQVGLMAQIYSSAAQVLVWLGPEYGNASAAFKALRNASKSSARMDKFWWQSGAAGIRRVCDRRYWTRLWVVQELVLAREIVLLCGASRLPWQTLLDVVDAETPQMPTLRQETAPELESTRQSRAASMIAQTKQARNADSLYNQVLASAHLSCSEPKDKIFALLSIVGSQNERIVPDYNMEMSGLLNAVLKGQHLHAKPTSLQQVLEQCRQLEFSVGVKSDLIFELRDLQAGSAFDFKSFPLQDQTSGLSFWWAMCHKHEAVQRLWLWNNDHLGLEVALSHAAGLGEESLCKLLLHSWQPSIVGLRAFANAVPRHPLVEIAGRGFTDITMLLLRSYSRRPSCDLLDATFQACLANGHAETALASLSTQLAIAPDDIEALSSLVRAAISHSDILMVHQAFDAVQHCSFATISVDSFAHRVIRDTVAKESSLICALLEGIQVLRNSTLGPNYPKQQASPTHDHGSILRCFIELGYTDHALRLIERPDVDVNSRCNCRLCYNRQFDEPATPLELAVYYPDTMVVNALLSRADLIVKSHILPLAISQFEKYQAEKGPKLEEYLSLWANTRCSDVVETLLRKCPKIHVSAAWRRVGLRGAIENNHSRLAELLLHQEGTTIDWQDGLKDLIFLAIDRDSERTVGLLLHQKGAKVDRETDLKDLLFYAIDRDSERTVGLLLHQEGMRSDQEDVLQELLFFAVDRDSARATQVLLQEPGLGVNRRFLGGMTAIMHAAGKKSYNTVRRLLTMNDLDITLMDDLGYSVLHYAARAGESDTVRSLLLHETSSKRDSNGNGFLQRALSSLDVNHQSVDGTTALMQAVSQESLGVVHVLLSREDLDVALTDCLGKSALTYAVHAKSGYIVRCLLLHPTTTTPWRDSEGNMLVRDVVSQDVLESNDNDQIAEALLEYGIFKLDYEARMMVKQRCPELYELYVWPNLKPREQSLDDAEGSSHEP